MHSHTHMTVMSDGDGDMCVAIWDAEREQLADIEFCTVGLGGGGSPRTHEALRQLMQAMIDDSEDRHLSEHKNAGYYYDE